MTEKADFASMFESSAQSSARSRTQRIEVGKEVEGTVLAISGGLVVMDIGATADATIDLNEFNDREIRVGDKIRATVKNARKDGPQLTLALGRGGTQVSSAHLERAFETKTPVNGTVSASVKGGFSVEVGGSRTFCPISHIDQGYVTEPEAYVGRTFDFLVLEFKEGGRSIVVSRKLLLEQQRRAQRDELLGNLSEGMVVSGTVKSTSKHGVVIDLGGIDGFAHISELSRSRVERPEDVVSVGESVSVKVLSIEKTDRGPSVKVSIKALTPAAQAHEGPKAEIEEILVGKVARHVPNGVIVSTEKGEGLVPHRELDLAPSADPKRAYPQGHELRIVVVSRDPESGKMRFSVSRVSEVEERKNYREFHAGPSGGKGLGSLGSVLGEKLMLAAQKSGGKGAK